MSHPLFLFYLNLELHLFVPIFKSQKLFFLRESSFLRRITLSATKHGESFAYYVEV